MSLEDVAQDHEVKVWLARQQPRVAPPMFKPSEAGYGPAECIRCEALMPELRRRNGWRLCTPCKSRDERRQ